MGDNATVVYKALLFSEWLLVRRCNMRGRYDLDLWNVGLGRAKVERDMLIEVEAIQWFSETLGIDLEDYFVKAFEGIYKDNRAYCYLTSNRLPDLPITITEPKMAYVLGIDYKNRRVRIMVKDERFKSGYSKRYYPMPDNEDDEIAGLGVKWGEVLKSFAMWAIMALHERQTIELISMVNDRLKGNIMLIDLRLDERIVIRRERGERKLKARLAKINGIHIKVHFPVRYRFLDSLTLASPVNMMPVEVLFRNVIYYSIHKKQGSFYWTVGRSMIIYLTEDEDGVKIDWSKMWIMLRQSTDIISYSDEAVIDDMSYLHNIYTSVLEEAIRRLRAYK